jgi:glutathione synthase/RimK-type ligase-like ATP-grasp enzyme
MQSDQYITDRRIVGIIRDICRKRGISFRGFSDDWVLELEKDGNIHRIIGYQFDLNNAVAAQIALDKVAAYQILNAYNIPAVQHVLLRTKAGSSQWNAVNWQNGVVIKPLLGAGGHGVALYYNMVEAKESIEKTSVGAWTASPLQQVKREVRILLLDGVRIFSYQKLPIVIDGLKVFNLGQGAIPQAYEPDSIVEELSKKAQKVLNLRICAVDIFELETGEWKVLEVNRGFMMEHYARISEENRQKTAMLYERIIRALFP